MDDLLAIIYIAVYGFCGLVVGAMAGAILFNKWFRREWMWRLQKTTKGFAFYVLKDKSIRLLDWDVRQPDVQYGNKTFKVEGDHIGRIGSIPVILIDETYSQNLPIRNSQLGEQWRDPNTLSAYCKLIYLMAVSGQSNELKILRMLAILTLAAAAGALLIGGLGWLQGGSAQATAFQALEATRSVANHTTEILQILK